MVTDKKVIEETAKRYCKETGCTQEEASLIREGFIEGAHWAIKEFKKSLWHDASEEPKEGKEVLYLCKNKEMPFKVDVHYKGYYWTNKIELFHITNWLYIEDVLPKKGGNDV